MEARKITIVNSRTQNRIEFQSTAETLGELKVDLDKHSVNYDGLAFFEGISKSEFTQDSAILPTNLPWKGVRTNDLIFMLTEPQKKIRNGAITSRIEAYIFIKNNNLQMAVQEELGNNFTRCKTNDLIDFCIKHSNETTAATSEKTLKKKSTTTHRPIRKITQTKTDVTGTPIATSTVENNNVTLQKLIDLLVSKGVITVEELANNIPTNNTTTNNTSTNNTTDMISSVIITDEDIDEMFHTID